MPSYSKDFLNQLNDFLISSAKNYQENLLEKDGFFMYQNSNSTEFLNVNFQDRNFAHLVGIKPNYSKGRITKSSDLFYKFVNAKNKNEIPLLGRDYILTHRADIMRSKMNASKSGLDLFKNARFIGSLNAEMFVNLYSEKLAGDDVGVIGFVWDEENYSPNTLLNADIKEIAIEESVKEISATFVYDQCQEILDVAYLSPDPDININSIMKMQDLILENLVERDIDIKYLDMSEDLRTINGIYAKDRHFGLPYTKPKEPSEVFSGAKDKAIKSFFGIRQVLDEEAILRPSLDDEIESARELSQQLNKVKGLNEITITERHRGEQEH